MLFCKCVYEHSVEATALDLDRLLHISNGIRYESLVSATVARVDRGVFFSSRLISGGLALRPLLSL